MGTEHCHRRITKMEVRLPNVAVLFLILTVQQSSIIKVSSVPEGLEKLSIEARKDQSDLFTQYFKNGFKCAAKIPVSQWCVSLNAAFYSESMGRKICSCACKYDFSTFLPQKQMCVSLSGAENFGGK